MKSLEHKLPEVRFTSAKQLVKALKAGSVALVTGPAGSTTALLDEAAAQLGASRTRVLRVRPPYPLSYFMQQVTPSTPDGHEDLLENAFRALTVLDPSCNRIALLVEDAHLISEATLRYIGSSLRLGAHLCVALVGEPKLLDTLALDSLALLRKRLALHIVMPGQVPAAPPDDAVPLPASPSTITSGPFATAALASIVGLQPGHAAHGIDGTVDSAGRDPGAAMASPPPKPARPRSFALVYAVLLASVCVGAVALELLGPSSRRPLDLAAAWTFTWPPRPWSPAEDKAAPESKDTAVAASAQPDTAYAAALPEPIGTPPMSDTDPPMVPVPASVADAAVPQQPDAIVADPGPAPRQAEAAPAPADTRVIAAPKVIEPEMAALPGGTFRMGSNKDEAAERPTRSVSIAPFLMAKKATTVREWQQCVDAKVCTAVPKGRPNDPMTNVSWTDVRQFAAWLSQATGQAYRLPTEAEWEYAARAGTETRYAWGSAMAPGRAGCKGCGEPVSLQSPPKVDAYPPNPFGLFGMGGGVAEWVGDCWHRTYQGAPHDGSPAWDSPNCRDRVLRGGSWMDEPGAIRVSSRGFSDAAARNPTHGFRLVQSK